jgi:hypothetical protein
MDREARSLGQRILGDEVSIGMPLTSTAKGCIAIVKEII